ncbi:MAG: hypothetical protein ABIJ34_05440 [archaeon]
MKLGKVMMVFMAFVFALATMGAVFAQEVCTDCCDGGPCTGDARNTPKLDVQECVVEINDRVVKNDVTVLKAFERGEVLDVSVEFVSLQDASDVQIMAFMTGYHRGQKFREDVFDMSSTFDVESNVSYIKRLSLRIPEDFQIDTGDELKLRIEISDKFSSSYIREYNLKVDAVRDSVYIQDVVLDPATSVQAGRGVFASVRVRNMGTGTEESIKVEVSMPALGLKATEYIDELDQDEATTSEDLFLRIPSCTEPGDYSVVAKVTYADGDESTTSDRMIRVTADEACDLVNPVSPTSKEDKTVVTVPGKQDVLKGTSGTVYPMMLQNSGSTDRSYELSATGLDSWATYRFDPGAFTIVKAGEVKTVYLYVTPKADALAGEKVFMVSVKTSGDEKQIPLTANVVESQKEDKPAFGDLTKALEIGVIVLIVLLIILGLIIGFNKLKDKDEPEEVSGQTYY